MIALAVEAILTHQVAPVWPELKGSVSLLPSAKIAGAVKKEANYLNLQGGEVAFPALLKPRPSTTEILLIPQTEDGWIVSFQKGFRFLFAREGQLLSGGTYVPVKQISYRVGDPLLITLVNDSMSTKIYGNGRLLSAPSFNKSVLPRVQVGNKWWRGLMLNVVQLNRALTPKEVADDAAKALAHANVVYPDTSTITLDLKLGAFTPVPDPARIKPYRNALLAHEYTVVGVKEGHIKGLKPGAKVRVFRYGVWDGKRTDIEKEKTGDRLVMTIKSLNSDPVLAHEYQLDDLPVDVSADYYVEVPAKGPGVQAPKGSSNATPNTSTP